MHKLDGWTVQKISKANGENEGRKRGPAEQELQGDRESGTTSLGGYPGAFNVTVRTPSIAPGH